MAFISFEDFLSSSPFVYHSFLWIFWSLILIITYMRHSSALEVGVIGEKTKDKQKLNQYLIKIRFGYFTDNYKINSTTISMDFTDKEKKFIIRLTIPPELFVEKIITESKETKVLYILFNKIEPIIDFGSVRISHTCSGASVDVLTVQIQDLQNGNSVISDINAQIHSLLPNNKRKVQRFSFKSVGNDAIGSILSKPIISWFEIFSFSFLVINISSVVNLIPIPNNDNEPDWTSRAVIVSLLSSSLSSLIFLVLVYLYQKFIKINKLKVTQIEFWKIVSNIIIFSAIFVGLVLGLIGSTVSAVNFHNKTINYYNCSLFFSLLFTTLGIFFAVLILKYFGFIEFKTFKSSDEETTSDTTASD